MEKIEMPFKNANDLYQSVLTFRSASHHLSSFSFLTLFMLSRHLMFLRVIVIRRVTEKAFQRAY